MALAEESRGVTWVAERVYAAVFVVVTLALLYWQFHGPNLADWGGYGALYDRDGGWLASQGRDPLFVQLIHVSRTIFGGNGYDTFRAALFAVFLISAARAAYAMVPGKTWSIFLAVVVVAAFLIKSLVQVREGLAFLLVLWPLVQTYRWGKSNLVLAGAFALVAPFIHSGAALFSGLWAMAAGLCLVPRILMSTRLPWFFMFVGVALGVAAARVLAGSASALEFSLRDLGIDANTEAVGGIAKYIYWIFMGVSVIIIGRQLVSAGKGSGRFGQALAISLGSLILPLIYTICLVLVFRQFFLPAVTSMADRLLFSSMHLALLIIGLRGKVNSWSIGIAAFLIFDQIRLLFETPIF